MGDLENAKKYYQTLLEQIPPYTSCMQMFVTTNEDDKLEQVRLAAQTFNISRQSIHNEASPGHLYTNLGNVY
jgi:hypothetical protein